jgi:hypothetical protein
MMKPHWPDRLPVAVPDIGFPRISLLARNGLIHLLRNCPGPLLCRKAALDCIVWLPSLRPWFGLHS